MRPDRVSSVPVRPRGSLPMVNGEPGDGGCRRKSLSSRPLYIILQSSRWDLLVDLQSGRGGSGISIAAKNCCRSSVTQSIAERPRTFHCRGWETEGKFPPVGNVA